MCTGKVWVTPAADEGMSDQYEPTTRDIVHVAKLSLSLPMAQDVLTDAVSLRRDTHCCSGQAALISSATWPGSLHTGMPCAS